MALEHAYQMLYLSVLIALAVLIGFMIIRSFIGPRILDRILSINMIGTLVITSLAICSRLLDESYLTDVALIYAMVSLLTVLVLSSVYLPKEGADTPAGEHRKNPAAPGMRASEEGEEEGI